MTTNAGMMALAEEDRIDVLRLKAFRTNSPDDRQAYFDAASKWFQDRHYRRIAASQPDREAVFLAENQTAWEWVVANCVDAWRRPRNFGDDRTLSDFLAEKGLSLLSVQVDGEQKITPLTKPSPGSTSATATETAGERIDTSNVACALICMLVSNPAGNPLPADWKRRVNDLIRTLRDERNDLEIRLNKAIDELSYTDLRASGGIAVAETDADAPENVGLVSGSGA